MSSSIDTEDIDVEVAAVLAQRIPQAKALGDQILAMIYERGDDHGTVLFSLATLMVLVAEVNQMDLAIGARFVNAVAQATQMGGAMMNLAGQEIPKS